MKVEYFWLLTLLGGATPFYFIFSIFVNTVTSFNAKYLEKCLGITGIPRVKRFTIFLLVFSNNLNQTMELQIFMFENCKHLRQKEPDIVSYNLVIEIHIKHDKGFFIF